jgi:hypothetical protein
MTSRPWTICRYCKGKMEFGVISNSFGHGSSIGRSPEKVTEWVRGLPKRSWFGYFKIDRRDRLQIATLRCTSCGYLELFAPDADRTCRGCGYDRTGLPQNAPCPECGLEVSS